MSSDFGKLLKKYREQSIDREKKKRFSQERLGEFIGRELGIQDGYSGATVSYWENGVYQIHKDDRHILIILISIFHKYGSLETIEEANRFLSAGYYSSLTPEEARKAGLSESKIQDPKTTGVDPYLAISVYFKEKMLWILELFSADPTRDTETPRHWSNTLLSGMGKLFAACSSEQIFALLKWIICWLLVWRFAFSLMSWPFGSVQQAWQATLSYIATSLILPLWIGLWTTTRNNSFWVMRGMASKPILRLYTHQGAMIGFNVGFGMVFIIALVFHNFGVSHFPVLLAGLAATWPVILGSASARQVPINLWRAYGDLRFKDGAIFFVIGLFGPLFGLFFFSYSEILLSPESGISILILAIGLLTGAMTYYRRRTGSSIIPPSTFVLLFGGLYWLLELAQGKGVFELTAFACLLTSIVVSLKLDQVPFSLGGGILLLGLSVSLWVVQKTVPGLVWMVVILAGFAWWRWGKNYVWFPLSFWLVIGGIITAGVLIQHFFLSILLASIGLAVFTFGVIFIQLYLARRNRTEKSEPK